MQLKSTETSQSLVHCLCIAFCVFFVYRQVSGHRFIEFDDPMYLYQNKHIIIGLTWESITWAFTNIDAANWHPLTWITHLVDRELFGPMAGGHLLMNAAWHSAAACLCYMALYRTTQSRLIGFSVAIVFALHPANVENVAWISERKSILDAFFWFLGILAYLEFLKRREIRFMGILIITHMLGLLSKPMHVTFPCTVILIHLLHYARTSPPTPSIRAYYHEALVSAKLMIPAFILSAYFSIITLVAQSMAMASIDAYTPTQRLINALCSYEKYLSMFFHPTSFAPFYPLFISQLTIPSVIFPITLLTTLTMYFIWLARKKPAFLICWLWFLGTMIPVIGLVHVGIQSHADRYLYIPMIGLALLMPLAIDELRPQLKSLIASTAISLTTLCLGIATLNQVAYWKDGATLFKHSLAVTGDCMMSIKTVIFSYTRQGNLDAAMRFINEKLKLSTNPNSESSLLSLKARVLAAQKAPPSEILAAGEKAISLGYKEEVLYLIMANTYLEINDTIKAEELLEKSSPQKIPESLINHAATKNLREKIIDILAQKKAAL